LTSESVVQVMKEKYGRKGVKRQLSHELPDASPRCKRMKV